MLEFAASGKDDIGLPGVCPEDRTQTQFGFGARDPALSGHDIRHRRIVAALQSRRKEKAPGHGGFSVQGAWIYQIAIRFSPLRTMASPFLHWKAAAKASMFEGVPMARNLAGACESVTRRTVISLSV